MENCPFDYSPLYHYKVDDMLFNINVMKKSFKTLKYIIYNFVENVHDIHNTLINSSRLKFDVIKSIDQFKVVQHDFVTNLTGLASHKFSDNKDSLNYTYNNITSGDAKYSVNEYWAQIHKLLDRTYTVMFNDGTKLVVLNIPSIQVNLDLNNRHFTLKYFNNSYEKNFELNSSHLSKVLKYINVNDTENSDIAIFNLLRFYESIYNRANIPNHELHILETKIDLVLHELEGVEKLIKLRSNMDQ